MNLWWVEESMMGVILEMVNGKIQYGEGEGDGAEVVERYFECNDPRDRTPADAINMVDRYTTKRET